ncbi:MULTISPECIES: sugar phosphate isomerase/epimerase [unclassified Shinella]|uniref:sugar phosphate isomerase/epimerase family protein n=1 Tax=unclassified Shinella TaxID=2643062 RepID=UPI00225C7CCA|nr:MULTISPECIES: sugar phosphate isomerase/epimerase [unclassified Shinella]MCO5136403.1 sugar phosphate isomerase/epimerase [Shinella sp.]MDC7253922.1 sugar phosphate isomerase/epimerase [Shinella sp. YE25]CAI0336577.1 putative Sugar phosphate isomerase/epimerase [Rhizobiaceae bacterium]CAK7255110.1 putative Sugar phosphate isomerase/epimerase [Shinella sp. WSC3-e]
MTPLYLAHQSLIDLEPLAFLETAAAAGFSGVSLRVRAAAKGAPVYEIRPGSEGMRAVRGRAEALGIAVAYVETLALDAGMTRDDYVATLETGAELGAKRLTVAGNDSDFAALSEVFAALSEDAAAFGVVVDLEFMPFRPVKSLEDAIDILRRAGSGCILPDALHLVRSGGTPASLRTLAPDAIGSFQLCDGTLSAPWPDDLPFEARNGRLLPGDGEFPLVAMIEALPKGTMIGVEAPLAGDVRPVDPLGRARRMFQAARGVLEAASRP